MDKEKITEFLRDIFAVFPFVAASKDVDGNPVLYGIVISETQPSGQGVAWIKPQD